MASTAEPGHSIPAPANAGSTAGDKREEKGLTQKALASAITLNSTKLIEELWTITQKQVDFEVARHGRLESKATSLLTATGLSLTVAFTFGSTLLKEGKSFGNWYYLTVLFFALSCMAGLVAAVLAVAGLMLREQRGINEHSLFYEPLLKAADVPDETKPDILAASEAAGLAEYRKAMILHLWEIRQRYHEKYKDKAKYVQVGQGAFLAFLGCLLLLCIFNVIALSAKQEAKEKQPPGSAMPAEVNAAPPIVATQQVLAPPSPVVSTTPVVTSPSPLLVPAQKRSEKIK